MKTRIWLQRWVRRILLAGFILVGGWLRFRDLGLKSLWHDEFLHFGYISLDFLEMLRTLFRLTDGELYPLIGWGLQPFGQSEFILRLPAALFGTLAIPAAYWAAREMFSRRVGLLSAAFVSINPFLIFYAQEARPYSLYLLMALLAYGTVSGLFRAPNGRRFWIAVLVGTLSVYTHLYLLFIYLFSGTLGLYVFLRGLISRRRKWRIRGLSVVGAGLIILLLGLPILVPSQAETLRLLRFHTDRREASDSGNSPSFSLRIPKWENDILWQSAMIMGTNQSRITQGPPQNNEMVYVLGIAMLAGIGMGLVRRRYRFQVLLAAGPVALFFLVMHTSIIPAPRHWTQVNAAWLILASFGAAQPGAEIRQLLLWAVRGKKAIWRFVGAHLGKGISWIPIFILLWFVLPPIPDLIQRVRITHKERWKDADLYLRSGLGGDESVLILGIHGETAAAYYFRNLPARSIAKTMGVLRVPGLQDSIDQRPDYIVASDQNIAPNQTATYMVNGEARRILREDYRTVFDGYIGVRPLGYQPTIRVYTRHPVVDWRPQIVSADRLAHASDSRVVLRYDEVHRVERLAGSSGFPIVIEGPALEQPVLLTGDGYEARMGPGSLRFRILGDPPLEGDLIRVSCLFQAIHRNRTANLIPENSFETWAGGLPSQWSAAGGPVVRITDTENVHHGIVSVGLIESNRYHHVKRVVPIPPEARGNFLTFGTWVKCVQSQSARILIRYAEKAHVIRMIPATGDWRFHWVRVPTDLTTTQIEVLLYASWDETLPHEVYFDEVSLIPGDLWGEIPD